MNYNFRFLDKNKYGAVPKKRYEAAISSKITASLNLLAPNSMVEVFALPLPKAVVKSMAAMLEFEDEASFASSQQTLLEKHTRHRKDLYKICDEIQGLKFEKDISVFYLYAVDDTFFAMMMAT